MKTYFVDSFTNQKYKGNPAAVCLPETDLDVAEMQSIATEIGFSETAFIKPITGNTYSIRFFSQLSEVFILKCRDCCAKSPDFVHTSISHKEN